MKPYVSLFGLFALTVTACMSPEDRFDDFTQGKVDEEGTNGGLQSGNEEFSLTPEQITGTYLYVVSTIIAPTIPTVYLAEVQADQLDDLYTLRIRQRPLSKHDRFTPVGPWGAWREHVLDPSGALQSEPIRTLVPAEANAVSGFDTESEITMHGQLFSVALSENANAPVTFFCGGITGRIISPIPIDDLTGSTFTGSRIPDVEDAATYPAVVINCNRDPARPLP